MYKLLILTMMLTLTACGAPKAPSPHGTAFPINSTNLNQSIKDSSK